MDKQKVNKLIERIQSTDTKLLAAVEVIQEKHPRDFAAAANTIGAKISLLYKTIQSKKTQQGNNYKRRQISGIDSNKSYRNNQGGRSSRGGGGRGHGSPRSAGNNNAHHGDKTMINGVDVSDPTRTFTSNEMERLGVNGRLFIFDSRNRMNNRGGNGCGHGGRGGQRNVSATDLTTISNITELSNHQTTATATVAEATSVSHTSPEGNNSSRGGQNGGRFGRGAYNTGRGCVKCTKNLGGRLPTTCSQI